MTADDIIIQETVGYFFCLEDRALLCRKCDVAIHTVNTFVSSHQRFLLTGVKVGQEATEHGAPLTSRKSTITKTTLPLSPTDEYNNLPPVQTAETDYFTPTPSLPPVVGSSPDGFQEWQLDDYLRVLTDINCIDNVPSKVNTPPFCKSLHVLTINFHVTSLFNVTTDGMVLG